MLQRRRATPSPLPTADGLRPERRAAPSPLPTADGLGLRPGRRAPSPLPTADGLRRGRRAALLLPATEELRAGSVGLYIIVYTGNNPLACQPNYAETELIIVHLHSNSRPSVHCQQWQINQAINRHHLVVHPYSPFSIASSSPTFYSIDSIWRSL